MINELTELSKTTNLRFDDKKAITNPFSSKLEFTNDDNMFESEKALVKRKTLICINNNPAILNKFETIITSISNLVDIMYQF